MNLKKRFCIFVFLFFIMQFILPFVYSASSASVSVNLTGPPGLIIVDPQNITYNYANNIPLNFISGGDNFWYNLDGGSNISIAGNTLFSTSEGIHILYLFANNSDGITKKNVTFTIDLSSSAPPSGGGGGGGGGGGAGAIQETEKKTPQKIFNLDKSEIIVKLRQGESIREKITIQSLSNSDAPISLENSLADLVKLDSNQFILKAGESRTILLDFVAGNELTPDLYLGDLLVKGAGQQEKVFISMEVESKNPLINIKTSLSKKYLIVSPGKDLKLNVNLISDLENELNPDLEYIIKDKKGNEILYESESKKFIKEIDFVKDFKIPKNTKLGKAVIYTRALYEGETSSSTNWFLISKSYFLLIIFISLLLILLIILYIKRRFFLVFLKRKLNRF